MELLNEFGFDWRLFVAQLVNFLVIAYLFKRFLYKPVMTTLKKREDAIDQGLKDAEKASKALEKAESEKDTILEEASKEAERVLNEARNAATTARDEILEDTRKESERIIADAKEQINLEREHFAKEAKGMALELAQKVLEQSIIGLFDEKTQQQLIKKGVTKIRNV